MAKLVLLSNLVSKASVVVLPGRLFAVLPVWIPSWIQGIVERVAKSVLQAKCVQMASAHLASLSFMRNLSWPTRKKCFLLL